jgi:hypothetical protein
MKMQNGAHRTLFENTGEEGERSGEYDGEDELVQSTL